MKQVGSVAKMKNQGNYQSKLRALTLVDPRHTFARLSQTVRVRRSFGLSADLPERLR
jgi:hypothetical protein